MYDEFPRGMRELGYVEGKNFVIEWRYADGKNERLPGLAAELVRLKVDVLVAPANYAAHAARQATTTIPIVTFMADPVGEGLVASLARPGGNITGLSMVPVNLGPKHLELLKTMAPAISRVAIVLNPGNSTHPRTLSAVEAAAKKVGVQILPVEASTSEEIEQGFAGLTRERASAVIVPLDAFYFLQRRQLAELSLRHRLPSIFSYRESAEAGGLMSYGQDLAYFYRYMATYVDRILKGAKPGELPIEQPTRIHFAINRKTAKALGLAIPQELLLRADEVIE
ncbi:MAG: ABC transporter substrate-binding protein [Burkholderiales bacterium]